MTQKKLRSPAKHFGNAFANTFHNVVQTLGAQQETNFSIWKNKKGSRKRKNRKIMSESMPKHKSPLRPGDLGIAVSTVKGCLRPNMLNTTLL